jgi:tetratricopeptide (TPR) repeat protein
MSSHIDVRTGRWAQAAEQNRQASAIDIAYRKISPNHGIYHFYMAHDDHFLAWSRMMLGRREEALTAARDMLRKIPEDFAVAAAVFVDPLASIEISALMRFGRWEEILNLPRPAEHLPITIAMWRFARGSALAALGKVDEALAEKTEFRKAVAALNEAVRREDRQRYIEPPDWFQPARHSLGAILIAAGRFPEAEAVYRADLERLPENGWALYGLNRALKERNSPEAAEVKSRFQKAWAHADINLTASCLCVSGEAAEN